jgi:hypothetical protein
MLCLVMLSNKYKKYEEEYKYKTLYSIEIKSKIEVYINNIASPLFYSCKTIKCLIRHLIYCILE